ncbi:MAG: ABC transporter permease [Planctomycetales bacterium]|nr:ABC transporter permease [Planctomycetales bacterium]
MIRTRDIWSMAAHNLWQRKLRTLLNLLGIVVGCVVLLMTAAGVSGVKNAIRILFDSAEAARQIGVLPDRNAKGDPPKDVTEVTAEMSEERRERIVFQLEQKWRAENRQPGAWEITPQQIKELSALPHVLSVVPGVNVPCVVSIGLEEEASAEQGETPKVSNGITGIDLGSSLSAGRVIAGDMLGSDSSNEVLLHEFVAYQLGYQSDPQLKQLLGKQLHVEYQPRRGSLANIFNMLVEEWGQLSVQELGQQMSFMDALHQLINELDSTSLTSNQKQLLRQLFPKGELGTPAQLQPIQRSFRIRGIVRDGNDDSLARLFRGHYQGGYGGIIVSSDVASEIHLQISENQSFHEAVVTVDSTSNLARVIEQVEASGTRTFSALRILENMDRHVDESAWIVLGIAAAILFTASIGISNTLLVSVLERTPEFGILKSVGATNSMLLRLMVCEGAILGLLGAVIAIVTSLAAAWIGHGMIRQYVESRLNTDIASTLFQFSMWPMLAVICVSVFVCVLASILPAWRASRLDPIVAMRRT